MTGERKPKMSIEEIKTAVLELPVEDRAELVGYIQDTLGTDPELEAAWRSEVERRIERIHAGDVEWFDADEVLAELEADP